MIEIRHQFEGRDWFVPDWELKVLILGTFNPQVSIRGNRTCGQEVPYFYGRKKNRLWEIVGHCVNRQLDPHNDRVFFEALRQEGIGCMDILKAVRIPEEKIQVICGKGYQDSELLRKPHEREYMTEEILEIIQKNPGVLVLPTWGKGSFKKKDKLELARLPELPFLHSPSPASRRVKFEEKRRQWYDVWHRGR